jgi:hypothetical protein
LHALHGNSKLFLKKATFTLKKVFLKKFQKLVKKKRTCWTWHLL